MKRKNNSRISVIFILLFTLVIYSLTRSTTTIKIIEAPDAAEWYSEPVESIYDVEIADIYVVGEYIKQLNIKYPRVVLAQAMLESGHMTSDNYLAYNNLFGMKKAYRRPTTATEWSDNNFAIYESWKESVLDYALYQAYMISYVNSEIEYLNYLGKHYAEDSEYVKKLKDVMNLPDFPTICEISGI